MVVVAKHLRLMTQLRLPVSCSEVTSAIRRLTEIDPNALRRLIVGMVVGSRRSVEVSLSRGVKVN